MQTSAKVTLLYSDFYNALYSTDGTRIHQGKPDFLNVETILTIFPNADFYYVGEDAYEIIVERNDGYPSQLSKVSLELCDKGGRY